MESLENVNIDIFQKKYSKLLGNLHSLILQNKLTHHKAIEEIQVDDLILAFLKEEEEELSEIICNNLKERVQVAKEKETVWEERRLLVLEHSRNLGVILKEDSLNEIIYKVPYNLNASFINLLKNEIQKWKEEQAKILKEMEKFGLQGTLANLNENKKIKFKVNAIFEVEYFKNKETDLIEALKRRLLEANFKSMPQIRVEPIVEAKQLTIDLE